MLLESTWTVVNGARMHALVAAQPRASRPRRVACVLVHGLGCSSLSMVPTAERLVPRFDVFVPDLPGFGRSDKPPRILDVGGLAGALDGWMEANGIATALLAGNSLGSQVVAELAVHHPDRALGVILSGPTVDAAHRTVTGETLRLIADVTREPWPLVLLNCRDYMRAGPWRVFQTLRAALADAIEDKLPRIQAPILLVRGSRDPIAGQPWVDRLTRGAPRASSVIIDGAAHAVNFSAPDRFSELITGAGDRLV